MAADIVITQDLILQWILGALIMVIVAMIFYLLPYQFFRPKLYDANNRVLGRVVWIAGRKKGFIYYLGNIFGRSPFGETIVYLGFIFFVWGIISWRIEHYSLMSLHAGAVILAAIITTGAGCLINALSRAPPIDPKGMPLVRFHFGRDDHPAPQLIIYSKTGLMNSNEPIYCNEEDLDESRFFFVYLNANKLELHRGTQEKLNHYDISEKPSESTGIEESMVYQTYISESLEENAKQVVSAMQQDSDLMKEDMEANTFTNPAIMERNNLLFSVESVILDKIEKKAPIDPWSYATLDQICESLGEDVEDILRNLGGREIKIYRSINEWEERDKEV